MADEKKTDTSQNQNADATSQGYPALGTLSPFIEEMRQQALYGRDPLLPREEQEPIEQVKPEPAPTEPENETAPVIAPYYGEPVPIKDAIETAIQAEDEQLAKAIEAAFDMSAEPQPYPMDEHIDDMLMMQNRMYDLDQVDGFFGKARQTGREREAIEEQYEQTIIDLAADGKLDDLVARMQERGVSPDTTQQIQEIQHLLEMSEALDAKGRFDKTDPEQAAELERIMGLREEASDEYSHARSRSHMQRMISSDIEEAIEEIAESKVSVREGEDGHLHIHQGNQPITEHFDDATSNRIYEKVQEMTKDIKENQTVEQQANTP